PAYQDSLPQTPWPSHSLVHLSTLQPQDAPPGAAAGGGASRKGRLSLDLPTLERRLKEGVYSDASGAAAAIARAAASTGTTAAAGGAGGSGGGALTAVGGARLAAGSAVTGSAAAVAAAAVAMGVRVTGLARFESDLQLMCHSVFTNVNDKSPMYRAVRQLFALSRSTIDGIKTSFLTSLAAAHMTSTDRPASAAPAAAGSSFGGAGGGFSGASG
ncbi:unnamed protein product, partial [Closterium sp. NIES-54]